MKYFARWLIVFSLIILGIFTLFYTGLIVKINDADVTKISFLILVLFAGLSIRVGYCLYRGVCLPMEYAYFINDAFLKLGLIGTVCGFIYMLYYTFSGINLADVASTQGSLIEMGKGMGTALYTTAAGLICNLILKVQLFIYEQYKRQYKSF